MNRKLKIRCCIAPWSIRPAHGLRVKYDALTSTCEVLVVATRSKGLPPIERQVLRLTFPNCIEFRTVHEGCDDCYGTRLAPDLPVELDNYLEWFVAAWKDSENCPDPGVYVAPDSAWASNACATSAFKLVHYVIPYEGSFIELLSPTCHWREYPIVEFPPNENCDELTPCAQGELTD